MDLSAIIFVVLAVAWAGYLIPKALAHHDEMARSRSVDRFSHKIRVLSRHRGDGSAVSIETVEDVVVETGPAELPARLPAETRLPTRAAARKAARRRRRVLGLLVLALAIVGALAYLAYVPLWSPAIPAGLALGFLVIARISVRRTQGRSPARIAPTVVFPTVAAAPHEVDADLDTEDTQGISRDELAAAVTAPAGDEGSLWDPLPVTLPTYVGKARARRTVRTIELTQTGVTSSGRSEADSALVREAEQRAADEQTAAADALDRAKAAGA
ncbi:MAG: hypothetical protein M3Z50_12490 [Actinomycetota bacterium]|nr:hypothetical protein [Actinomycetota bacterium]